MKVITAYIAEYTILLNKYTLLACFPFIVTLSAFQVLKPYYQINILLITAIICLLPIPIFYSKIFNKIEALDFQKIKYSNALSIIFNNKKESVKKVYYRYLIENIIVRDFIFYTNDKVSYNQAYLTQFTNEAFKKRFVEKLTFRRFCLLANDLPNNVWLRDVFNFQEAFLTVYETLEVKIRTELNQEQIENIQNSIINNLLLNKQGISLNEVSLSNDLDAILNTKINNGLEIIQENLVLTKQVYTAIEKLNSNGIIVQQDFKFIKVDLMNKIDKMFGFCEELVRLNLLLRSYRGSIKINPIFKPEDLLSIFNTYSNRCEVKFDFEQFLGTFTNYKNEQNLSFYLASKTPLNFVNLEKVEFENLIKFIKYLYQNDILSISDNSERSICKILSELLFLDNKKVSSEKIRELFKNDDIFKVPESIQKVLKLQNPKIKNN